MHLHEVNAGDQRSAYFTWGGVVVLTLAAIVYGWFLSRHVNAYAGGADSSGYMNHARLLRAGELHVPPRAVPELGPGQAPPHLHVPLGFRPAADGRTIVPTYPAGLPLLIMGMAAVVGWDEAANVVIVIHAILGLLLTHAMGAALGLPFRWAFLGAVIVAGSPIYLSMSLQTLSDMPALVWTTGAVLAAWRSRSGNLWAIAAGLAYAMAVLVRPTNTLALAPIAIALGADWRRWVLFGAGGLPGALFFCAHSYAAYGRYLTTGYGGADLKLDYVPRTLAHYARWLPVLFTPVIAGCLLLPWHARTAPRAALVLAAWIGVFAAFYAAYYNTHEAWWYLRFLLPAAPALVVGGLLGIRAVTSSWLRSREPFRVEVRLVRAQAVVGTLNANANRLARSGLFVLALALTLANTHYWSRHWSVVEFAHGQRTYPLFARWLREQLPPDAVVAAMQGSGAIYFYTDLTFVRWDQFDAADFPRIVAALRATGRPLYAALFPFEVDEQNALQRMPGRWAEIANVREVRIWKWHGPDAAAL